MLASASNPFLENLQIDLFSIIPMPVSYGTNPCSRIILQQKEAKVTVLGTNLLGNVDPPLSPLKSDTFNQAWLICLGNEFSHIDGVDGITG